MISEENLTKGIARKSILKKFITQDHLMMRPNQKETKDHERFSHIYRNECSQEEHQLPRQALQPQGHADNE